MTTKERIPRLIYIAGVALIGCAILFGGWMESRYEIPGYNQHAIHTR